MPLNDEQTGKLTEWMRSKRIKPACPGCGANKWTPGELIASPTMQPGSGQQMGGPTIPMVQLVCGDCAYVMLFAAVPIGLP